jgi:receptor expression-enhancing protein 5/6
MDKIEYYKEQLDKYLHKKNFFADSLELVEKKSGVQRIYIAIGMISFTALWLLVGYGAQFLANFIGFVYPAYCSIKAIESTDKNDDTVWLTYWVVYAFFSLLEFFTDIFLFWIPFYAFLKCLFLLACMAPTSWNVSLFIYDHFLRPLALRHQRKIDEVLDRAAKFGGDISDEVRKDLAAASSQAAAHHLNKQE